jgi:hypothetical protein
VRSIFVKVAKVGHLHPGTEMASRIGSVRGGWPRIRYYGTPVDG